MRGTKPTSRVDNVPPTRSEAIERNESSFRGVRATPSPAAVDLRCGARYRRSIETSSVRWRCERPPMVLLGEIRHPTSTLLTFTRPYFGTARSMSKTFAVSMYAGGSSRRSWIRARPPLRSRLSWARRVLISLARSRASIRWTRLRSGAATPGLVGVFVAGGMGGESTSHKRADKPPGANSAAPQLEVQEYSGDLTVKPCFAGLLSDLCGTDFTFDSVYAALCGNSLRRAGAHSSSGRRRAVSVELLQGNDGRPAHPVGGDRTRRRHPSRDGGDARYSARDGGAPDLVAVRARLGAGGRV